MSPFLVLSVATSSLVRLGALTIIRPMWSIVSVIGVFLSPLLMAFFSVSGASPRAAVLPRSPRVRRVKVVFPLVRQPCGKQVRS